MNYSSWLNSRQDSHTVVLSGTRGDIFLYEQVQYIGANLDPAGWRPYYEVDNITECIRLFNAEGIQLEW